MRSTCRAFVVLVCMLFAGSVLAQGEVGLRADAAAPQFGKLAAAAVTGTTLGTCNTLVTLSANRYLVQIFNSLNQTVDIAYNGAQAWELEAGESFVVDLRTANFALKNTKTVCVWAPGTAPVSGTIRATLW